ncbi:hypothetical protein MGN70_003635 [Eutypa lata]|nr:hypothetical protein MGN70_003634 [Eutypa lata]KAI1254622.1 hypothetical protein MGN70_003635 [Eutypa lata]
MTALHPSSKKGLVVIHAALFRMGTKSMADAYNLLGYQADHGQYDVIGNPWVRLEEAAEAKWPWVPSARPRSPFSRADWDRDLSKYDVVTDTWCYFAPDHIRAYPDAKVVLVQRDFDTWWPSIKSQILAPCFSKSGGFVGFVAWYTMGIRAVQAMRKAHCGFFGARNMAGIESNAHDAYEGYFQTIRELVPPEQLLEYRLGDGWEPLCAFLGKDVPNVPFPRANDRAFSEEGIASRRNRMFVRAIGRVAVPGAALLLVLCKLLGVPGWNQVGYVYLVPLAMAVLFLEKVVPVQKPM